MCADEDDEEDDEEDAPKTQKVKETVWDWALLNENKALWLRAPGEVDEEDYEKFYKALAKVRRPFVWLVAYLPSNHCCCMHRCHLVHSQVPEHNREYCPGSTHC